METSLAPYNDNFVDCAMDLVGTIMEAKVRVRLVEMGLLVHGESRNFVWYGVAVI